MQDSKKDLSKALIFLLIGAAALPGLLYCVYTFKSRKVFKWNLVENVLLPSVILLTAFLAKHCYLLFRLRNAPTSVVVLKIILVWLITLSFVMVIQPLIQLVKNNLLSVRVEDYVPKVKNWKNLVNVFEKTKNLPLGVDIRSGNVIQITPSDSTAHVLVIGSTGTGKTTLMKNMILHAIKHRQPCVVIDPKGDDSTLNEIRTLGVKLDPNLESRIKVFSISKPKDSSDYNPLKHGNANQLKDRLLEALNWSEQFYQAISASFLSELTGSLEYIGVSLTLDKIARILEFKDEQQSILKQLKKRHDDGDAKAEVLYHRLNGYFTKGKDAQLSGLAAQIAILNNPTFGHLLSFDSRSSVNELDLRELRKSGGIAYFQLDTLGNGDSARRLGRMIIEDLKSLSSEIYKTEPNESSRPLYPVFIDEFGSFAAKEFVEFQKQSRGSKFSLRLFCQGLEDLDVVSSEFRRQIISNSLTKIALRVDDDETVNEFCATAGTFDAEEMSFQVNDDFGISKTGMGNLRLTKQMVIEHDILKNLKLGEAVVVDKSSNKVSGIKFCHSRQIVSDILN